MEYVSYKDLKARCIDVCGITSKIPYFELLGTFEWQKKREEIIERDKQQCQECGRYVPILNEIYLDFWRRDEPYFDGQKIVFDDPVFTIFKYDYNNREYVMEIQVNGTSSHIPYDLPTLHVHHKKYYIENKTLRLPWEYEEADLITYCTNCHAKYHLENKIEFVDCDNKRLGIGV